MPTLGSAAHVSSGSLGGNTVVAFHVLPPSVEPYARIVPSEKLFDAASSTRRLTGWIATAASLWAPGRFETFTSGPLVAAVDTVARRVARARCLIRPRPRAPRRDRDLRRARAGAARVPSGPRGRPRRARLRRRGRARPRVRT